MNNPQLHDLMLAAVGDSMVGRAIDRAMGMLPPDTSLAKKDRKAWARYQTRIREIEIAAEEKETGKKHRSRKISRSGRRKKR